MNFWFLVQVLVNLILFAGVVGMWIRLHRPQKDDPRLSKGLQLLQSKIAILEDLSDRTEVQVGQLTALLEQKCKEIQNKIQLSEKQLSKIEQSTQKSLEVAKIFQDRIPHTEIVERQNTIKYVKAARLAHQGLSTEEIAQQVDLSRGEIDFIAKVNKDQLMFCEDSLPEWIQDENTSSQDQMVSASANQFATGFDAPMALSREIPRDMSAAFEMPSNDQGALKKLGEAFKAACADSLVEETKSTLNLVRTTENFVESASDIAAAALNKIATATANVTKPVAAAPTKPAAPANMAQAASAKKALTNAPNIRPVEFRRIDMNKDLG